MSRLRNLALATLLVLAGVEACDLNPQPLPPIDGAGAESPSDGENTAAPPSLADAGSGGGKKDSGPSTDGGYEPEDAGDSESDAGDANVDAGDDGSVSDDAG